MQAVKLALCALAQDHAFQIQQLFVIKRLCAFLQGSALGILQNKLCHGQLIGQKRQGDAAVAGAGGVLAAVVAVKIQKNGGLHGGKRPPAG